MARGDRGATDAVKSVTTCNEIAADLVGSIVFRESNLRLWRFHVVHAHIRHFKQQWLLRAAPLLNEILHDLVLPIDSDLLACERRHIDTVAGPKNVEID